MPKPKTQMNPLLQSSLQYQEYLAARIQETRASSMDSSGRRKLDSSISRGGSDLYKERDEDIEWKPPPLVHSWRRHLNDKPTSKAGVLSSSSSHSAHTTYDNSLDLERLHDSDRGVRRGSGGGMNNTNGVHLDKERKHWSSHVFGKDDENDEIMKGMTSWSTLLGIDDASSKLSNLRISTSPDRKPVKRLQREQHSPREAAAKDADANNHKKITSPNKRTASNMKALKVHRPDPRPEIVVTSRLFRQWIGTVRTLKAMRETTERRVVQRLKFLRQRRYFFSWRFCYTTLRLRTYLNEKKLMKSMTLWKQAKYRQERLYSRAEEHYRCINAMRFFRKLRLLIIALNEKRRLHQMKSMASKYFNKSLLRRLIIVWRFEAKKLRREREIEREHEERKERIRKLVSNLSNKGSASSETQYENPRVVEEVDDSGFGMYEDEGGNDINGESSFGGDNASYSNRLIKSRDIETLQFESDEEVEPHSPPPPAYSPPSKSSSLGTAAAVGDKRESNGPRKNATSVASQSRMPNRSTPNRSKSATTSIPSKTEKTRGTHAAVSSTVNVPSSLPSSRTPAASSNGHTEGRSKSISSVAEAKKVPNSFISDPVELETRAKERRQRIALLKKQSEERIAKRHQEEMEKQKEKAQQEEEAFNKLKEEKRLKMEMVKADSQREKDRALILQHRIKMADKFRRSQLLVRAGFAPWCRLIEQRRWNTIKAKNFRNDYLLQSTWIAFYGFVMMQRRERAHKEHRQGALASAHRRRKLLRTVWRRWILYRKMLRAKAKAVTGHFSRFTLSRRAFKAWRTTLEKVRRKMAQHMRFMAPRGDLCTLRYYFRQWSMYLEEQLIDRDVRNRSEATWAKVQAWLK